MGCNAIHGCSRTTTILTPLKTILGACKNNRVRMQKQSWAHAQTILGASKNNPGRMPKRSWAHAETILGACKNNLRCIMEQFCLVARPQSGPKQSSNCVKTILGTSLNNQLKVIEFSIEIDVILHQPEGQITSCVASLWGPNVHSKHSSIVFETFADCFCMLVGVTQKQS